MLNGFLPDLFANVPEAGSFPAATDDVHLFFFRQIIPCSRMIPESGGLWHKLRQPWTTNSYVNVCLKGMTMPTLPAIRPGRSSELFVDLDAFETLFDEGVDSIGQIRWKS